VGCGRSILPESGSVWMNPFFCAHDSAPRIGATAWAFVVEFHVVRSFSHWSKA
jgi:membrane-associated PAP2 superfamily phosphatase